CSLPCRVATIHLDVVKRRPRRSRGRRASSLTQHPPAAHDHARHCRWTSHASACAIVVLSLGLLVYARHCPSWHPYRQVPPKASSDTLVSVSITITMVASSLTASTTGVRWY